MFTFKYFNFGYAKVWWYETKSLFAKKSYIEVGCFYIKGWFDLTLKPTNCELIDIFYACYVYYTTHEKKFENNDAS